MPDRRARIPANEVADEPRNWNLPFWTEPTHVVESPEDLDGEDDVLMEVAEVETVAPLTADELEVIRQEAYNEGLQQGLVEGRQKGEKLGHDTGLAQGLVAGKAEGHKLGYESGKEEAQVETKGRAELQRKNLQKQLHEFMQALNGAMLDQQTQIENTLPSLVEALAKAVVTEELSQGSEHIVHLVKQAISVLPVKLKDFTIEINHNDFPFIETALEQKQFTGTLQSNEAVEPGGCLIHSEKSLIDFTLANRLEGVLKDYHQKLQLGDFEDEKRERESQEAKLKETDSLNEETQEGEPDQETSAENLEAELPEEPQESKGLVDIPELIDEEYQPEPSAEKEPSAQSEPSAQTEPSAQSEPSAENESLAASEPVNDSTEESIDTENTQAEDTVIDSIDEPVSAEPEQKTESEVEAPVNTEPQTQETENTADQPSETILEAADQQSQINSEDISEDMEATSNEPETQSLEAASEPASEISSEEESPEQHDPDVNPEQNDDGETP